MKREKTSPWKKYQPHEIKRYFKIWWRLRSQKRYSEANRVLLIYRYPPFWLPVIGLLILYGIFWWPSDFTEPKGVVPVIPLESVTDSKIDWASVRQAARSRRSNVNFHEAKYKLYKIYWDLGLTTPKITIN